MKKVDCKITQVIGCAYTYRVSKAVRHAKSQGREDHSAHDKDFSYFKKVENVDDIVSHGGDLLLRSHPQTSVKVEHWYEAELAILLGDKHRIVGYALANDLTATGVEFEESQEGFDPTYFGKVWPGSCSIGNFVQEVNGDLEIGLKIERGDSVFERGYSTKKRKRDFDELPQMVLDYHRELSEKGDLLQSKQISVDGCLPRGTVILTGTGLITKPEWYAQEGDVVTVYSESLGELRNKVR